MGGWSGPGAGLVIGPASLSGRRTAACRAPAAGRRLPELGHRQQEAGLAAVEHQLADLVAEERAGLLLPLAARSAAPSPSRASASVNRSAQRLQPIRKPTRIGCGAWLCSGETVSWCTRAVRSAGLAPARRRRRGGRRRRAPARSPAPARARRGRRDVSARPAARRSRRRRPSAPGRRPAGSSRRAGPAGGPSWRTLSVSFQRSRWWIGVRQQPGQRRADDQVLRRPRRRPARMAASTQSNSASSSIRRPLLLEHPAGAAVDHDQPGVAPVPDEAPPDAGRARCRPARPSPAAAARRRGPVGSSARPRIACQVLFVGELLRAEVAQVLVDPVAGQAAGDPAAATTACAVTSAPPGGRGVPVVDHLVVVEDHRRRDGGQQPAHLRVAPGLEVEPGVLLEVDDLAPPADRPVAAAQRQPPAGRAASARRRRPGRRAAPARRATRPPAGRRPAVGVGVQRVRRDAVGGLRRARASRSGRSRRRSGTARRRPGVRIRLGGNADSAGGQTRSPSRRTS